ncbi:MAG: NAD(P)H-hydrate epimerase [Dehalococcoidales bacterium]
MASSSIAYVYIKVQDGRIIKPGLGVTARMAYNQQDYRKEAEMALPGISTEQMKEVDRLMTEERGVSVELMMEHAGLSLARLAVRLTGGGCHTYQVIAGAGNNGGGGLVAARRLAAWGLEAEVYLARGRHELREIPGRQLERLERAGVRVNEGLPLNTDRAVTLDAYLGYGFKQMSDAVSAKVFGFLAGCETVISLDAPSGLDVTSGENVSRIRPLATLTIAFVKSGLMAAAPEELGELYIADIGVPTSIYRSQLGINWQPPYDSGSLEKLAAAFWKDALQPVAVHRDAAPAWSYWQVATATRRAIRAGPSGR